MFVLFAHIFSSVSTDAYVILFHVLLQRVALTYNAFVWLFLVRQVSLRAITLNCSTSSRLTFNDSVSLNTVI